MQLKNDVLNPKLISNCFVPVCHIHQCTIIHDNNISGLVKIIGLNDHFNAIMFVFYNYTLHNRSLIDGLDGSEMLLELQQMPGVILEENLLIYA